MDANKMGEAQWTAHLDRIRVLYEVVEQSQTRGENGVLLYLYHVDRPMFPGELTEKLGLTTGRIANILKELEKSRLVVRKPDGADKRRVQVYLTPAGEAAAQLQNRRAVAFHNRLISALGPEDACRLEDILGRMAEAVDPDGTGLSRA